MGIEAAHTTTEDPSILGMTRVELGELFRAATQQAVEEHLAAGRPVYGSYGTETVYAIVPRNTAQDHEPEGARQSAEPESRAS